MLRIALTNMPAPLRKVIARIIRATRDPYANKCYSQEGEDIILKRIFHGKKNGFYVDVGAHHPRRFSNTFLFYRKGWSGINIEPNPDAAKLFIKDRCRDINLEIGISDIPSSITYYFFSDPALNTFDRELATRRLSETTYRLIKTQNIRVERLDDILTKHVPPAQPIDFLSVDAEGLDLKILQSNDWLRFRPHCVLAESFGLGLDDALSSDVASFMLDNDYRPVAKTYNTLFFVDRTA